MTTTSSIDGWEVVDYLGPVSAQFVIGTGLFADLFSSFTDFFGAHSHSYQKKLDKINAEALSLIEQKALRLRANAVLGLRVDHDEISGSGKSMLMVTASGTGVRVQKDGGGGSKEAESPSGAVSALEVQTLMKRMELLQKAREGTIKWEDRNTWQFIIENEMEEMGEHVLNRVLYELDRANTDGQKKEIQEKYQEYFFALSSDSAKVHLYGCLTGSNLRWSFAEEVIKTGNLFDPSEVFSRFREGDLEVKERCVQLAVSDASYYTTEDAEVLEELASEIRSAFPEAETYTTKSLLGEKTVWECSCGNENSESASRCSKCTRDRYGFYRGAVTAPNAAAHLETKAQVLRTALDEA